MTSTPIIDEVIDYLINKGYKVNVSRNIFKNDNNQQYNNSNKNKVFYSILHIVCFGFFSYWNLRNYYSHKD